MSKRNQINFAVDGEVRQALDEIRALRRPIPSISDAIRQAILSERDALRRRVARDRERGGADDVEAMTHRGRL